ncbi:hypothetical protein MHU86_10861 [Fragilaria crotonensis]|nr:hypothetical protein MHU86_10861 [Fragilaria crotonensis]
MNAALQRCGFNAPTVTLLIAQGFATPNHLMLATESDLDSIARSIARSPPRGAGNVTMPFIAVKNLKGFRFWADERKFTAKCQEYQEQKEAAKDEDASKPDSLKKLVNWALWNEDEREAPENVLDPADFGSPMEYLIEATVLEGRHYELDNPRFYRELKTFVVSREGWSYIKKFERSQDGRKAYVALKTQCEGTASKITRKNNAYASITNASYSGSRCQYKFQDFINVHQTAHNEILDCDPTKAVPESKKVADFLKGITDPKLESAVLVVLGDPKLLNNFQACQQYLSTTVENRATLERSKERNISDVKSGEKTDKTAKAGKLPKGFKLENKYYLPKIFQLDTARSRHGYFIKYADCPLLWKSQLQTEVALSSTESKYTGLSYALRDAIPVMELLKEMKTRGYPITTAQAKLSRAPSTMTEVIGPPPAPNPSVSPDPDYPMFSIGTDVWLDPPNQAIGTISNDQIGNPRPFFLEHFRLTATPLQWNRYILLGFFSHTDGAKFDAEWNCFPTNLIHRNKIVWCNFMFFVDRHIDIPFLLEAWAIQVAQPYLLAHDPSFLEINTTTSSWESFEIYRQDTAAEAAWTTVGADKHSRSSAKKQVTLTEPEHRIRPPLPATMEAPRPVLTSLISHRRPGILKKPQHPASPHVRNLSPPTTVDNRKPAWKPPAPPFTSASDTSSPVSLPPKPAPQPEGKQGTDASVYSETSTLYPDSRTSTTQVKTNDGTQRITIRWTPKERLSYHNNPSEWTGAALAMLHDLFGNNNSMGAFYPWGNVYLSNWKSPQSLTVEGLHEYISPKITYIRSTKTFIFATRFGFSTKTPVTWLTNSATKQVK